MLKSVGQVNNITQRQIIQRGNNTFGATPVATHPTDYYTYTGYDSNINKKIAGVGLAFVGLSAAFSYGFSKLFTKILNKTPSKKFAIFEGVCVSFISSALLLNKIVNKKLKPISEDEQAIKEQKIKAFAQEVAKKKNTQINGLSFNDFSKSKINKGSIACYDLQSGYIVVDSRFKDTDLDFNEVKPVVVHELTHAKQFENIIRSKDGIYDLNKIYVINEIKTMDDKKKERILSTPDDKMKDLAKHYMKVEADKYTFVDDKIDTENETNWLKAIKMYLKNPNISKYELPLMIYEPYYKEIAAKGPISPEDEKKVQIYLNYMKRDAFAENLYKNKSTSISANIDYMKDPMEIEAYAATGKYIKTGEID